MIKYIAIVVGIFNLLVSSDINFSLMSEKEIDNHLVTYNKKIMSLFSDDDLIKDKKLINHDFKIYDIGNVWVNNYIRSIIVLKKETDYKTMTSNDIEILMKEIDFMSTFQLYIKGWIKDNIYNQIDTKIINLTRSKPTEKFPLGKPTIDNKIRSDNQKLIKSNNMWQGSIYNQCHKYMEYMSKEHEKSESFVVFLSKYNNN